MAAVSIRDEYTGAMPGRDAYTRSRSDHNMARSAGGGHSVSTANMPADVSTAAATAMSTTAMSTTTMSATAATMAPAFGGSIGGK
jgi:hypothetical protein